MHFGAGYRNISDIRGGEKLERDPIGTLETWDVDGTTGISSGRLRTLAVLAAVGLNCEVGAYLAEEGFVPEYPKPACLDRVEHT